MADYTPIFSGGSIPFTAIASGAITGGTLVTQSSTDKTVATSGSGDTAVVGVAAHDAVSGAALTVWPVDGPTHEITSTGTIAAGSGVAAGAAGVAAGGVIATLAAAGTLIGVATKGATGGALLRFQGRQ